jgi:hypothetical protein
MSRLLRVLIFASIIAVQFIGQAVNGQIRGSAITLNPGENYLRSAVLWEGPSIQDGYAYFGTGTSPGKVVAVRTRGSPPWFGRGGALILDSGENDLRSAVIDPVHGYAYFGTHTLPGRVVKISIPGLSRVDALTLLMGEYNLDCAVIDTAKGFAYFGVSAVPSRIVKINLSSFSRVGGLILEAGEDYVQCGVIDTAKGFAYFGTYFGTIVKINLSTFTRSDHLATSSENCFTSAVIDTVNGFAYFGSYTLPGKIVKVDLGYGDPFSTFTQVGTLTLEAGENYLTSAVIDAASGFAYFGTSTPPGRVVKIRLSDFTRVGAITLAGGENYLTSAAIDPPMGHAFFGTSTLPGRVVYVQVETAEFDFRLSSAGGISVLQGDSDLNTIDVALTSGGAQPVTLSASGLPRGASASFAPFSGTTPFNSTCTVFTSSSTPKGTYTITVTGTGGGLTRTTTFTLIINTPLIGMDQLSGAILQAATGTVYFIRTGNIFDDSTLGFVFSQCDNLQNIIIQTDSSKINQTSGAPLFTSNVVLFGGYAASKVVNYYEGLGYAPIGFSMNSTHFMFIQGSTVIYSALRSTYDRTKADYFVAQIYMDGPRTIFSLWGIAETGTYASGLYFSAVMHRDLGTYTQGYLICKWTDLNNDGIQTSNEITVVATGT